MMSDSARSIRISCIVPVHNAGAYIARTVESFCAQTVTDAELLLVDNASSDDSLQQMRDAALRHPDRRIRILSEPVPGVSRARNAGMDAAVGTYLVFWDADDIQQPTLLEDLARGMEADTENRVDLAVCRYRTEQDGQVLYEGPWPDPLQKMLHRDAVRTAAVPGTDGYSAPFYCSRYEMLYRLFLVEHYQGFVWNKIFRRELVERHHLRFAEGIHYNEDRLFLAEYLLCAEDSVFVADCGYRYQMHVASAQGQRVQQTKQNDRLRETGGCAEGESVHTAAASPDPFERGVTEMDAFVRMYRLLRAHARTVPDPHGMPPSEDPASDRSGRVVITPSMVCDACLRDMYFSLMRIFRPLLTDDVRRRRNYSHSRLRVFARQAAAWPVHGLNAKEQALRKKLLWYGWTGDTYTPDPGWFDRAD